MKTTVRNKNFSIFIITEQNEHATTFSFYNTQQKSL